MYRSDPTLKVILLVIAVLLAVIALRPLVNPEVKAQAQSARFDHVTIVATTFLYKGQQGLLLMDRRNANVWFMARTTDQAGTQFAAPVFLLRVPFDKLDQGPQ